VNELESLYKDYLSLRGVRYWVFEEVFKTYLVLVEMESVDLDDVCFLLEEHFSEVDELTIREILESVRKKIQFGEVLNKLIYLLLTKKQYKKILAVLSCELFAKTGLMLFQTDSGFLVAKSYSELIRVFKEVNYNAR